MKDYLASQQTYNYSHDINLEILSLPMATHNMLSTVQGYQSSDHILNNS